MKRKDIIKLAAVTGFFALGNLGLVIAFWTTQHRIDMNCLSIVVVCGTASVLSTYYLVINRRSRRSLR